MTDCVFCKIIKKEIPSQIVFENEKVVAFKDTNPAAQVHLLVVPKKHIPSVNQLEIADKDLVGEMLLVAQKLAKAKGIVKTGYRLSFNTGPDAGQTVDHLHLHLMGGEKLPWS